MTVENRINLILLIDKMQGHESFCAEIGLSDISKFPDESSFDFEEKSECNDKLALFSVHKKSLTDISVPSDLLLI